MKKITYDFKNRTAIVTGGAQGFGFAITEKFLASGAKVLIWDIDEKEANDAIADALKQMKSEFKDKAGRSISVKEESRDDSIEVISTSHMSPRKHAYYRMNVHLRVA